MIAILVAKFNAEITDGLRDSAILELKKLKKDFEVFSVPGAIELSLAAQHLIHKKKIEAVIVLGAILKGETDHYEYVFESCVQGLTRVALNEKTPVIQGVQVGDNFEILKNRTDRGAEYARTAVEMIEFLKK
ncbi:6,7-dimethyl-8-ribityllumazine synthase [bacterium]|jgi:6,7-dimethyl-8-ribityllumazine synthase|nr:6,7-dimethyl-8-ribityllumazine synthase [bacterium]MBT6831540.1 6,7-dimethyl-8-ribityllumazine synthase [bacterium]MBT6996098.1 6,7-dimethyl-8-ribityllumazine synthase [bacterium]MBT7772731.1 6,7-dimethyl-8-ribityllumazine synthase [bacterium]